MFISVQFSSISQSCPTLFDHMNCSTPGLPVCNNSRSLLKLMHIKSVMPSSHLGTGMKTDLFQSCGHCWVFQICWHMECSTFTASSFRIWNSSTGILSHPLALFIMKLSEAHLTSHFRMSGSRWVIIPFWLPGWWRYFVQFFFLYILTTSSYILCILATSS